MRTTSAGLRRLKKLCTGAAPAGVPRLELPEDVYAGVACWSTAEHWLLTVRAAYAVHYRRLRSAFCDRHGRGGLSAAALMLVARARAKFADFTTGRSCRPSVATLMRITGASRRVVQRASLFMRLVGAATEVVRGRQRTKAERLVSHKLGDRSRGWTSVYALHPPRDLAVLRMVTPHPRSGARLQLSHLASSSLEEKPGKAGLTGRASRDRASTKPRQRPKPDAGGLLLAARWRKDPGTPQWARQGSPESWANNLKKAAAAGWTPNDLNAMLRDFVAAGGWIPDRPHNPRGFLGRLLNDTDLADRPAFYDDQRAAEADARRAAIAACTRCGPDGYLLDDSGVPLEPVKRCDHL